MLLLKNITLYDGTGSEGYPADILIDGERIARITKSLGSRVRGNDGSVPDAEVIDCTGLAAAPGFIDIHAHSEYSLLAAPAAPSKIMQGVTTEVSGNCGLSAAPLTGDAAKARQSEFAELGITQTWEDFPGYFDALEKARPALNFATYCGHGNLRASVMGYVDRKPTEDEFRRMETLLADALEAGAMGLSTGLIYPPGVYSDTAEIVRLAKVVAKFGGVYTSHMRSESARVVEAIEEAITVGREAGIPVQVSHLKTAGQANWHKISKIIDTIEKARAEGLDVSADRYPYTASSTDLDAILPAWAYEGGNAKEVERLKDPATRAKLREAVLSGHPVPEYWRRVMIASVSTEGNRQLEGKTLAEAAEIRGQEPAEALFDILIEEGARAQAIYFSMSEDNLRQFLSLGWMMVGSDSTARGTSGVTRQGKPHPRGFGSFPRVLGKYARDEKLLSLPQAVRKMTGMSADRLGLKGRGYIKEGLYADVTVFNPSTVIDTATFEDPYRFPNGIEHVLVNGKFAVRDGKQTAERAGKILRCGQ
ncbi:MAG: N-acyl-D-amino-acid deacylase family protein [Nitrospirota bacterium]